MPEVRGPNFGCPILFQSSGTEQADLYYANRSARGSVKNFSPSHAQKVGPAAGPQLPHELWLDIGHALGPEMQHVSAPAYSLLYIQ